MQWMSLLELFKKTQNDVQLVQCDSPNLNLPRKISVDEHTTLGQMLINTRKIRINKYLRILSENIVEVNDEIKRVYPGKKFVVATDVWGGYSQSIMVISMDLRVPFGIMHLTH